MMAYIFRPLSFIICLLGIPVMSVTLSIKVRPNKVQLHHAKFIITYQDVETGVHREERNEYNVVYGNTSPHNYVQGKLILIRNQNSSTGCNEFDNEIPTVNWIALIERGQCKFHDKIHRAYKQYNTSAVVIYDNQSSKDDIYMGHSVRGIVNVFISHYDGSHLVDLLNAGNDITMEIKYSKTPTHTASLSKMSVLFVSISFIVLMIVSLAWLVFYYIQRFRYVHAKDRLTRRLANAAKKAISRIPLKVLKECSKELVREYDQCAICIETYKPVDIVRVLPCNHVFHKSCVDPWLLDHRSCPMCKMDILRALGLQLNGSQESLSNRMSHRGATRDIDQSSMATLDNFTILNDDTYSDNFTHLLHHRIHLHRMDDQSSDETLSVRETRETQLANETVTDGAERVEDEKSILITSDAEH